MKTSPDTPETVAAVAAFRGGDCTEEQFRAYLSALGVDPDQYDEAGDRVVDRRENVRGRRDSDTVE